MNKDINSFGTEFEREMIACKKEEDNLRKLKADYEAAKSKYENNNKERIKIFNQARLRKIEEIKDEMQKVENKLKELEPKLVSGLTKEVKEEYIALRKEKIYLKALLYKLCNLFGHDAHMVNAYEDFECDCCGEIMDYRDYIKAHHAAKYKGIVPYYYNDDDYVTRENKELELELPAYEGVQKMLRDEKKQK